MQRTTAMIFGYLLLGLALVGLVSGDRQMLGFLNVDLALDLSRVGLAALLLYAVYMARSDGAQRLSLMILGGIYLGLGTAGLFSPTIGGLLPSGLSTFDIAFHLIAGLFALNVAVRREHASASHA